MCREETEGARRSGGRCGKGRLHLGWLAGYGKGGLLQKWAKCDNKERRVFKEKKCYWKGSLTKITPNCILMDTECYSL